MPAAHEWGREWEVSRSLTLFHTFGIGPARGRWWLGACVAELQRLHWCDLDGSRVCDSARTREKTLASSVPLARGNSLATRPIAVAMARGQKSGAGGVRQQKKRKGGSDKKIFHKKKKTEACFLLYLASTNRTSVRLYLATAVVVAALPLHWLEAG